MKVVYFELSNGKIIPPYSSLPRYMAFVERGKVKEIYTCFGTWNIRRGNQEWIDNQLEKERESWDYNELLMKTLKRYIKSPRLWFKGINHKSKSPNRFIYIKFWSEDNE